MHDGNVGREARLAGGGRGRRRRALLRDTSQGQKANSTSSRGEKNE